MGKRSYRGFETTFKRQLVEQIEAGRLTPTEAAREHRVARSLIERWRQQYLNTGLVGNPSIRERRLEAENEKLKAKVGELVLQMDPVKKMASLGSAAENADTSVITAKNLDQFRKPAK